MWLLSDTRGIVRVSVIGNTCDIGIAVQCCCCVYEHLLRFSDPVNWLSTFSHDFVNCSKALSLLTTCSKLCSQFTGLKCNGSRCALKLVTIFMQNCHFILYIRDYTEILVQQVFSVLILSMFISVFCDDVTVSWQKDLGK